MSLSSALNNANTGLGANARGISVVSSNVSNALTEGYGRRELQTSPSLIGGVKIDGVLRHSDKVLLHDRRLSSSSAAAAQLAAQSASRAEELLGDVTDPSSLFGKVAAFEASLTTAAADPSSNLRLQAVSHAAQGIADKMNTMSDGIQAERQATEAAISEMVDTLNDNLARVDELNTRFATLTHSGAETATLLDERQIVLDRIAEIVPIRVIARDREQVAVVTIGGLSLIDYTPVTFDFDKSNVIQPHMTGQNGMLSDITIKGEPFDIHTTGGLAGGALEAAFIARDVSLVQIQGQIDALALDLAERFGAGGPDTSLTAGQPGLFGDAGSEATLANVVGLAGRLTLNSAAQPDSATLWRLRDGLGATAAGPTGDARLLSDLAAGLSALRTASSPELSGQSSFQGRVADLGTAVSQTRIQADDQARFATVRHDSLRQEEQVNGVDTDLELQNLMKLEQNYAANAQVIKVVDDLLQLLLQR